MGEYKNLTVKKSFNKEKKNRTVHLFLQLLDIDGKSFLSPEFEQ